MKITEIIASRKWFNIKTGQTASIYGAVPYHSETDKVNWVIKTAGYTWQLDNGTIGLGRAPAKTYEGAKEVMDKFNKEKLRCREK